MDSTPFLGDSSGATVQRQVLPQDLVRRGTKGTR